MRVRESRVEHHLRHESGGGGAGTSIRASEPDSILESFAIFAMSYR